MNSQVKCNGRSVLILFLLTLVLVGTAVSSLAAPAAPGSVRLDNPDGSSFNGHIQGDEFQHWIETDSGHSVVRNPRSKAWEYAEKAPDGTLRGSGMMVVPGLPAPAQIKRHLKPKRDDAAAAQFSAGLQEIYQQRVSAPAPSSTTSTAVTTSLAPGDWTPTPVSGSRKILLILVNFSDRTLTTTANDWYGSVFDTTPGVKSVANFYKDNSFGALSIQPVSHSQTDNPAGVVTVTVPYVHPYNGTAEQTWVSAAIDAAASYVNFAALDADKDGILERNEAVVYFIVAGYEQAVSGYTPSIWAHATSYSSGSFSAGGVNFQNYALSGELYDTGVQGTMGVIAHEMGHQICGLPDLYDTTYTNAGMGDFSLMAGGSWGADIGEHQGATPVALDAWSREYLGWLTPVAPSVTGALSLGTSLSSNAAAIKLIDATKSTSEYFLAENRYPTGWDRGLLSYLGGNWSGGLLVTHIDITVGTQGSNDINKYVAGAHQGVMVEQASTAGCDMTATDCSGSLESLYYSSNNDAFTDASTPSSKYYSSASSDLGLSSISAAGQTMTVLFSKGNVPPAVSSIYPTENAVDVALGFPVTVTFSTDMNPATINGSAFTVTQGGTPVSGAVSYDTATKTASFTPSAPLLPTTVYTATVTDAPQDLNGTHLLSSKSWTFTTGSTVFSETFDAGALPAGWSVVDNAGTGAVWRFDDPGRETNLTGGSGSFAIADSDNAGSVAMDTELRMPVLDLSGYSAVTLKFRTYFQSYDTEVCDVDVSANGVAGPWTTVWSKSGGNYGPAFETVDISAQAARKSSVVIRFHHYNANFDYYWQVDNVELAGTLAPSQKTLSLTFSGTGGGSVNSSPAGIASTGAASATFDVGTPVTLMATPGATSAFSGWSGACTGTGNCVVTMDADRTVDAGFALVMRARVVGSVTSDYATLVNAFASPQNGASVAILAQNAVFMEDLLLNKNLNILFRGGYDAGFSSNSGSWSTLDGTLTVGTGALTVENLIIQ